MFNNSDLNLLSSCVSNIHRVTLTRNTVHRTFLFFWGSWGIDVSEEASQGRGGPEGNLDIQGAGYLANPFT